jgi:cobalt-zinc-cadmium efflux system outer membrane protein
MIPFSRSRAFLSAARGLVATVVLTVCATPVAFAQLQMFDPPQNESEVISSTLRTHPALDVGVSAIDAARAAATAADSLYDTVLGARGTVTPLGYYPSWRLETSVEQLTPVWGMSVFGGYRLGIGDFASYYGERATLNAGELQVGLRVPLMRDRRVDRARAGREQADLSIDAADAALQMEQLRLARLAAEAYWRWAAALERHRIADELLQIALERDTWLVARVQAGAIAPIEQTENQRAVLDRQSRVVSAQREVERASIALSLFWRSDEGVPKVPSQGGGTPVQWPELPTISTADQYVEQAMALRPEFARLVAQRERARVSADLARNNLQPRLDGAIAVSQDMGSGPEELTDSNAPTVLDASLSFSLPVQRRLARSEQQAAEAELMRIDAEVQQMSERLQTEVLDALSAYDRAIERVRLAEQSVQVAEVLVTGERQRFDAGATTLFFVNVREQSAAEAQETLVSARAEVGLAIAQLRTTVGLLLPQDLTATP